MTDLSDADREALARRVLSGCEQDADPLLARLGFAEPELAGRGLDRLSGPGAGLSPLPPAVLAALARWGNPDQGLRNLERLVGASGLRAGLFGRLAGSQRLREHLTGVLSHGSFLTDILVRNPELLFWLLEGTPFLERPMGKPA
ncbi:MAG: hypothetical protein ABIL09_15025, partial [Gemmatimonadota bacterium]